MTGANTLAYDETATIMVVKDTIVLGSITMRKFGVILLSLFERYTTYQKLT